MGEIRQVIKKKVAAEIAARVSATAYMSYAYSEGAYRKVAEFLFDQELHPAQVEWVMDSKHMRWASDASDGRRVNSETFKRYWAKHEDTIRLDLARYAEDVAWYATVDGLSRAS